MRFWLTRGSDVIIREQIESQVSLGVLSGDLAPGERMPGAPGSRRTLALTLRQAQGRLWAGHWHRMVVRRRLSRMTGGLKRLHESGQSHFLTFSCYQPVVISGTTSSHRQLSSSLPARSSEGWHWVGTDRAQSRKASFRRIRKTVSRPRACPELVEGL